MQIKTISGYLTPTNKVHIKALFERGLMAAKVNTINYLITNTINDNIYHVVVSQKDNSIVIGPKISVYKSIFKLQSCKTQ